MEENLLIWFSSWKSSGCAHNKTSIVCITIHICLLITFFIGWHMSPLFKKTFILFILQLCVERDFNRSTIEIFISIILAYMIKPQWVKHWIVFNVIMNLRGKTNNIYIYIYFWSGTSNVVFNSFCLPNYPCYLHNALVYNFVSPFTKISISHFIWFSTSSWVGEKNKWH